MIARIWSGRTKREQSAEYLNFLRRVALPDYASVDGCLGAYVLHREEGETAHFQTLSFWSSEVAIASFAGSDMLRAKYYPEDAGFLLDFPELVEHFEVVGDPPVHAA